LPSTGSWSTYKLAHPGPATLRSAVGVGQMQPAEVSTAPAVARLPEAMVGCSKLTGQGGQPQFLITVNGGGEVAWGLTSDWLAPASFQAKQGPFGAEEQLIFLQCLEHDAAEPPEAGCSVTGTRSFHAGWIRGS